MDEGGRGWGEIRGNKRGMEYREREEYGFLSLCFPFFFLFLNFRYGKKKNCVRISRASAPGGGKPSAFCFCGVRAKAKKGGHETGLLGERGRGEGFAFGKIGGGRNYGLWGVLFSRGFIIDCVLSRDGDPASFL